MISIRTTVSCDGCGAVGSTLHADGTRVVLAQQAVTREGWSVHLGARRYDPTIHYCPTCREGRNA
jgi:hypothetical protein